MTELEIVTNQEDRVADWKAYTQIPYGLIGQEVNGAYQGTTEEFSEIENYYRIYKKGAKFVTEGTNADYVAANLHFKTASSLIDKEARFLFAEAPDIIIEPKGDVGKATDELKDNLTIYNDLIKTVLDKNNFEEQLLKAAKDCFIGKRVACLVNFNEEDGVVLTFLPANQFLYEVKTSDRKVITKFVCFQLVEDSKSLGDKRYFKKKYELEDGIVYLTEEMYDGAGQLLETLIDKTKTLLKMIPVSVFVNDGLLGDMLGQSEIEVLKNYESYYSKLANADIDAERKSMNPIRYAVDMEANSTKELSSSAGSFWDLQSDQNLENPNPSVGVLENSMSYSESLKTSLDRIKVSAYEQIDMPKITLESMQGTITSGKALKAIYWPLIVRCKEKMKMWGPQLANVIDIIIQGSLVYPNCIKEYVNESLTPISYEISISQNTPLPEDEAEEKEMDLQEVAAKTMSKKSYMKKWRGLTDDEVQEELEQIALERQYVEDATFLNNF